MPFITQNKTNWKFLLIVIVLAVIVGGGIIFHIKNQDFILIEIPETEELKKTVLMEKDFNNWSIYKSEELGFEMKIPPLFEQNGYFIDEGVSIWFPFEDKECRIISFQTGPIDSQFVDPPKMGEMMLIYMCPLFYCETAEFKKICDIIRNDKYYKSNEDELYEAVFSLGFSDDLAEELIFILWGVNYLTEGEKYIAYLQTFHGQGDFHDAMGWNKEEVYYLMKQMLSTFRFIKKDEIASKNIRNVDFIEYLTNAYYTGMGGPSEFCTFNQEPIYINYIKYYDLDNDGEEETIIQAYTCFSGTAGPDINSIYKLLSTGEVIELKTNNFFQGKSVFDEHNWKNYGFDVRDGKLINTVPIYNDNDSNCCPTGGIKEILYEWDGKEFIVTDIIIKK